MPWAARSQTLPPLPPSPPSGQPKGKNFSRRKLTLPRPPLPACTRSTASSTNFIADAALSGYGSGALIATTASAMPCSVRLARRRSLPFGARLGQYAHIHALVGPLHAELHAPGHHREQRVIGADSDVFSGAHLGAALAYQDIAREHRLAAETLHA